MPQNRFFLKKAATGAEMELVGEMVAGHMPECGLQLQTGGPDGSQPSRRHAKLSVTPAGVTIEDLKSTNGTFVNGKRLTANAPVSLRAGDKVRFDVEEFQLRVESPPPPDDRTIPRSAASAPKSEAVAAQSEGKRMPGAWAMGLDDPKGGNKTEYISEEEMEKLRQQALKAGGAGPSPAADTQVPYLIVQTGSRAGEQISLRGAGPTKKEWHVGSDPDREIVLTDAGVSGKHAKIVNDGESWKLIDQLASNGTFVNGTRTILSFLNSGDRLRFGPVECVFQLPTQARAARSAGSSASKRGGRLVRFAAIALVSLVAMIAVVWFFTQYKRP